MLHLLTRRLARGASTSIFARRASTSVHKTDRRPLSWAPRTRRAAHLAKRRREESMGRLSAPARGNATLGRRLNPRATHAGPAALFSARRPLLLKGRDITKGPSFSFPLRAPRVTEGPRRRRRCARRGPTCSAATAPPGPLRDLNAGAAGPRGRGIINRQRRDGGPERRFEKGGLPAAPRDRDVRFR